MTKNIVKLGKFVVFQLDNHWFALPMAAVLRVVNCPPPEQGGDISLGVVQLGPHMIRLLDWPSQLGLQSTTYPQERSLFLLVMRGPQESLWAIALDSPPDLMEIPLAKCQRIPPEKRLAPKLQWVSHMVVLFEQEIQRSLLFLDLKAIFQSKKIMIAS